MQNPISIFVNLTTMNKKINDFSFISINIQRITNHINVAHLFKRLTVLYNIPSHSEHNFLDEPPQLLLNFHTLATQKFATNSLQCDYFNTLWTGLLNCLNARSRGLTFRHRASCIQGQAFRYTPENAFYIFNQQMYFII